MPSLTGYVLHDDVIKWQHFPRCWPFVRGIHRSPMNSQHKGQWPGALTFSLICAWMNGWVNDREAGDLKRHRVHYDVTVMLHSHIEKGHWSRNILENISLNKTGRMWRLVSRYSFMSKFIAFTSVALQIKWNWFYVAIFHTGDLWTTQ